MVRYIKCPRCNLNYIDAEKQDYCDVCLKEMRGLKTDADELEEEEDKELPTELCPVCGENMMRAGEEMCDECRKKTELEEEDPDPEEDEEWRNYLDDDGDEPLDSEIGLDESMKKEFADDAELEEEEEEFTDTEEEDLEYVTGDEIYTLAGDDDDDDDDEDKQDEDDF